MGKKINVPAEALELPVIASVSGGKDSTALMLALKEAEVPFQAVFADTGWEAPETYEYLDLLRKLIGPIEVVRPKRDMVESVRHRAGFPARMQRWCTRELKIIPVRKFHDELGEDTISAMGIRADESESRRNMPEWEDSSEWGGWVWRPLISWSVEDVIEIHRRHSVPMNPLYHQGFDRVGCFPCIFARKEEIRHLPEWRVDQIEKLEKEVTEERVRRLEEKPDRYAHSVALFFQPKIQGQLAGIREVVAWAKTARGGKQLDLLAPLPQGGCMRWGMCESPKQDGE